MKYEYCIWDFDGTLSDSYPCFARALLDTLEEYGLSDTYESAYAKLKVSIGYALRTYDFPVEPKTASETMHRYHEIRALTEQQPFPEAEEILKAVVERGGQNFIYSHSGEIVTRLLKKWGLYGYFTEIVDNRYKFPRKPAPDALNFLCEKRGLDKSRCLMIGDRDIDTDCGRNAGIAGCLFDADHYYDRTEVEYRVTDLLQIRDIL